jgi:hypothetical protein
VISGSRERVYSRRDRCPPAQRVHSVCPQSFTIDSDHGTKFTNEYRSPFDVTSAVSAPM